MISNSYQSTSSTIYTTGTRRERGTTCGRRASFHDTLIRSMALGLMTLRSLACGSSAKSSPRERNKSTRRRDCGINTITKLARGRESTVKSISMLRLLNYTISKKRERWRRRAIKICSRLWRLWRRARRHRLLPPREQLPCTRPSWSILTIVYTVRPKEPEKSIMTIYHSSLRTTRCRWSVRPTTTQWWRRRYTRSKSIR